MTGTTGNMTQFARSHEIGRERLSQMILQRDELNAAIGDLQAQLDWGEKMMTEMQPRRAG